MFTLKQTLNIRFFIIIITGLFIQSLTGQTQGSFVGLRGGVSFPVGQYASKSLEKGCFTQVGFTSGVEGAWYFMKYLGVGGQFSYNLHTVDVGVLGYEKVKLDPFLLDLTIRSDPYQIITGTVGLFSKWNFWNFLSVHGKILGGMMWAKTPYQLYKPTYYQQGPEYYEITPSRDRNFMVSAGLGLQFDLSPCIALRAEGEYQYSNMIFGFKSATGTRYENRVISFVNNTLSLVIKL